MYSKLYRTIFDGSLYGNFEALTVFMAMLALSDVKGEVDCSPIKISDCLGAEIDFVLKGLKQLEEPDPYSRTPAEEGRRIIPLLNDEDEPRSFGWRIVNYEKYKAIRNEDERREYKRGWDREHRSKAAKEAQQNPQTPSPAVVNTPEKPPKKTNTKDNSALTAAVWEAYTTAYHNRYGTEPVRNARVNAQLAQFVQRVGKDDAPGVAAYYVQNNNHFYVVKGHAVGLLLADAEKLRTEWATSRQVTNTQAGQVDKRQSTANVFHKLLDEAKDE